MVVPNLLHPVPISVETVNKVDTIQDDNHREPIQQSIISLTTGVPGQVKIFGEEMEVDAGGRKVMATGYVLFRYTDLNAHSLTLRFNDRFKKLGNLDTFVFIVGLTQAGHYPDQGGATMVKAFFNDRQPATGGFDY